MKEIILNTKSKKSVVYKKYKAIVDDENYDKLVGFNWTVKKHGQTFYARGNVKQDGKNKLVYMHRFIKGIVGDELLEVDHIDHNGLNNQIENLRICNRDMNAKNRKKYVPKTKNSSKYKGVTAIMNKRQIRYVSRIRIDGKLLVVGNFDNEIEAAIAYNIASLKYHKEYGELNVIDSEALLCILKEKEERLKVLYQWMPEASHNSLPIHQKI